jgi:TolA-binding protein
MVRVTRVKAGRAVLWAGVMGIALCAAAPAQAQINSREGIALQNQIADLRQQMAQLQNGSGNGAPPAPVAVAPSGANGDLTAQLLERVNALEDQNRQMRGELDQLSNQVQQQSAAMSKQISDMNFAMQNGQGGAPGASAAPSADGPPAAAPPAPTPQPAAPADPLAAGRAALMQRDYAGAERNGRAALAAAKTTPAKVDAQYLVAQSLAGQRQYRQSAVAYYDAYSKAPHAPRAQDALLGVAASMLAMGDKHSACQALDKLHAEFPTPQPRVRSAAQAFASRASCH